MRGHEACPNSIRPPFPKRGFTLGFIPLSSLRKLFLMQIIKEVDLKDFVLSDLYQTVRVLESMHDQRRVEPCQYKTHSVICRKKVH